MSDSRLVVTLPTKRAVIYARFSTDLQNERSIEDQVLLCRRYAAREDMHIVKVYEDRARSGGSIMGRDGLLRLLDRARDRAFDVVIVEAQDLAGIHKRLSFFSVEIRAIHEGVVNTVLIGLRGLVGQLYREDNAHKVRRGQAGRITQGLHAGGLTYGYAPVPGQRGRRTIVEAEAEIVRRIFNEYIAGRTPREIAHDLNKEGVSPPRGRLWNSSTINGNRQRGAGILQNELYAGHLVWNKVRVLKDPDTGRRISRPNGRSAWQTADVPDLAIIPDALFEAVQNRKDVRARTHPSHQRRLRHILSGLLRCGACGGGMSTNGKDKSGQVRIRCSRATESGTCPDPKTFYLKTVESAVLSGLKAEMRHPRVISEFVRTYHEERKRLAAETDAKRSRLTRRLSELDREIDRLVDGIAKGLGDPAVLGPRSSALHQERRRIAEELNNEPPMSDIISLHPATLARYEQQLADLQDALSRGVRAGDEEAASAIRNLVETVTVYRDPSRPGGVAVEIVGRLNALLGDQAYPNGIRGVWGKLVAGERYSLSPHLPNLRYHLRSCA